MSTANPISSSLEGIRVRMEARQQQELAAEEQKRFEEIEAQRQEGKCKLIPFPSVATQPFRSELTLERHPLFVVNAFKGDFVIHERTVEHPQSKEPIVQRVLVGKLDKESKRSFGVLKQVHQELFYKLLKLWGEQGYPLSGDRGVVRASVYELVMVLSGNDGTEHYRRIRRLLRELASIPITIENAYTWQGLKDFDEFTLVDGLNWNVRKLDKETLRPRPGGKSRVEVLLSKMVTDGFLMKNVKQLLWQPYASLKRGSEVARLLYPMLDHELSTKDQYHVSLASLAERFGMAHQRYKSDRRRPFTQAVKLLDGKPVLGEKYRLRLKLVESADGEDYVLEARRAAYQLELHGV